MTAILQQLSEAQSSPEVPVNENFETLEFAACYGKKQPTTAGLVWGYYGGSWGGFSVAAGTFTLTGSATNYIVAAVATGVTTCSTSVTNWNNSTDYKRVYKITTTTVVTVVDDYRAGPGGVHGSGGGSAGALAADTDGTLAANSDSNVATQKAVVTFVNAKIAGNSWKTAVRAATTANGTLASAFANGQTIDGVTLATGDRILLKNQTSGTENGIYVVAASGAPTRATDADSGVELVNASVMVSEGTTLADTQWTCSTNAPITVGVTSLAFVQFNGNGMTALTGDVTASGAGSVAATIANDAVTYAKMQNASATARILARKTAGSGDYEEATLSDVLDFITSAAQGDILYRGASAWARRAAGTAGFHLKTGGAGADPSWVAPPCCLAIACSDEATTALTAGTNKVKFINPYSTAFNVTSVVASLSTAQASGSIFTVDINEAGTSILSTKLTIDNTETNSNTAATPPVISDPSIAAFAEIEVDIDQVGDGTAKGLKIYLLGYPT